MNLKDILSTENGNLPRIAKEQKNNYFNAKPFPNIVFKNFFNEQYLDKILLDFPNLENLKKTRIYDNQNEKIDRSIKDITRRQINKIKEWENQHPNWDKTDDGTTQYIKMVRNVMGGINENDNCKNLEIIKKEIGENINIQEIFKNK